MHIVLTRLFSHLSCIVLMAGLTVVTFCIVFTLDGSEHRILLEPMQDQNQVNERRSKRYAPWLSGRVHVARASGGRQIQRNFK